MTSKKSTARLDRRSNPRLVSLAAQRAGPAAHEAEAACGPWEEEALFRLSRRAWPYRDLPRDRFDAVVAMLSEGIATRRGRAGALLHRDAVHGRERGRRGARLAALTGGGAIPDNAQYAMVAEPEQVAARMKERFGGLVDRVLFSAPVRKDPARWADAIAQFHT